MTHPRSSRKRHLAATTLAMVMLSLLLVWTHRPRPGPTPSPVRSPSVQPSDPPSPITEASIKSHSTQPPVHHPIDPAIPSSEADSDESRLALVRCCLELADRDPLAAMGMAATDNLCEFDPGLLTNLVVRWAENDFTGAHQWLRKQPPDAWRDDMLARLAYLRAKADPQTAARITVTDIPPGPQQDEAVISVIYQWAGRDPTAARKWAETLPSGPLRERALSEIHHLLISDETSSPDSELIRNASGGG